MHQHQQQNQQGYNVGFSMPPQPEQPNAPLPPYQPGYNLDQPYQPGYQLPPQVRFFRQQANCSVSMTQSILNHKKL
jgi:hypothetical protein